ncbi:hypothetical protein HPB50_014338 [Hyalomma asiaticum]|uniref:Uncharacterized protein n=1 Tax=Hyalomma asiaticum TaxID=266040 RepID=A0ACB7SKY8_HYAAI|nr:hypothetical protein HPB50_014338 [Hyalomma asiaticum]
MSRFGIVPVFDVKQLGSTDHDAKDRLLTALQEAIKQVQNVTETAGASGMTEDIPEACWLCEHLDRVFLYGLQEPQWGYWPWVRKFTHPAAQQEIASLSAVSTDLGYGRAWLLASLNGGLLESYMLSFRQNLRLLRKGYSLNSLLRDPQGVSVMTISSTDSSTSSREDDSGIQSVRVSCATLSSLASPAEEVHIPETCSCAECVAFLDRQRIQRIINLDVVPQSSGGCNEAADLELEVTRVVITQRKGRGQSAIKPRTPLTTCGSEAAATVMAAAGKGKSIDGRVCAQQRQDLLQVVSLSDKGRTGCLDTLTESSGSMRDSGCYAFVEGDRGAPDGCEEVTDKVRQEGRTTDGREETEEMFSIYDCSGKCTSSSTCDGNGDDSSSVVEREAVESSDSVEPELLIETSKAEGFDIKVENNALLYLTLEIFESDDEKLYKMFLAWKCFDGRGLLEPIYVLITNKFLYILRPAAEVNQFSTEFSVRLSEVKVVTDGELIVKDYRLVHWEKCIQSSPGDFACGPSVGGPSYVEIPRREHQAREEKALASWLLPVAVRLIFHYFPQRAGVLYRFSNQGDTIPSATYLVSGVHCGSCQAVSNVGRPHALQLNLAPSGGACLQLAASNEVETERWVHALTEAGQASFYGSGSMGGMVACCLVLVGDLVLTLVEGSRVLGVGVIIDLSVVRSENNFCIMVGLFVNLFSLEFDGGEAESCAYNWIFWFATEEEKNEFLSIVSISWQEMFKVPLEVAPLSSGTLKKHCLERASQLEARLKNSRAFCLDN